MKMMRKFKKTLKKVCKKNNISGRKCKKVTKYMMATHKMTKMMEKKHMKLWIAMGGKYNKAILEKEVGKMMKEYAPFSAAMVKFACKMHKKMAKKFCSQRQGAAKKNCQGVSKIKNNMCAKGMEVMMKHKMDAMACKWDAGIVAKGFMKGMKELLDLPKDITIGSVGKCVTKALTDLRKETKKMERTFERRVKRQNLREIPLKAVMDFMFKNKVKELGIKKSELKDKI